MHHLAAFYSSLAQNAQYAQIAGVADAGLTRNPANLYTAPGNLQVLAAYVQGVTTSRCQLQAPSLRQIAYPEIAPIQQSAIDPAVTLAAWRNYYGSGPRILMNENFGLYGSENNTGASPTVGALWITDRWSPAPGGAKTTLVGTTSNTLVAQQWTLSTIAFETQLAAGRYSIIGLRVQVDDANLARLVFPGATNFRPGVIVAPDVASKSWLDQFNDGGLGEFGQFDFNNPPQLEVFGHTAGAENATIFLDVIKLS